MVDGPDTMADTLAPGSAPATGMVGKKLGAYRIDALIGEGAMGEVYRGMHEKLQRPVAIKTLKPAVAAVESMVERFFAEARAVNVIRHENIVECTDLVNDPGGANYIVMELLSGLTLKDAIHEAGTMTPRRAVRIAAQIADAIAAAHDAGIVHRDLKPDNVFLIKRAGSPDYVKVLDFGIARLRPDLGAVAATQSGAMIGTPAYMSPEQVKGERAGPPADIYALGVILYQMLTGKYPFNATSVPLMLAAHVNEPVPKLAGADIPPALAALVEQMLAKEPEQRPETMANARAALLDAVGLPSDVTASALSIPTPQPFRAPNLGLAQTVAPAIGTSSIGGAAGEIAKAPPPRRRTLALAGGAAAVAAIAVVAIVMVTGNHHDAVQSSPSSTTTPTTQPTQPTTTTVAPVSTTPTPTAVTAPPGAALAGSATQTATPTTTTTTHHPKTMTTTAKTPKQPTNTGSAGSAAKPPEPPKVKDKTRELIDDDGSATP